MSSSCCGGSAKSEHTTVATTPAPQATAQQPTANSEKTECCNGKPEKNEKDGCCC